MSPRDRTAAVIAPRTTIVRAEPLVKRWLRLTFEDGAVHEVDLAEVLSAGGVFAAIRDAEEVFRAVTVDQRFGTVVWPGGVDLDPDVLRGNQPSAMGKSLPRRIIQTASAAATQPPR